jgi:hypothetical protein
MLYDPAKRRASQKRANDRRKASRWAYHNSYKFKLRKFLNEYKAGKACADCKGHFPTYCMYFDHLDPATKVDKVSRVGSFSMRRLLEELPKCELVCANCHRIRTFTRRPPRDTSAA